MLKKSQSKDTAPQIISHPPMNEEQLQIFARIGNSQNVQNTLTLKSQAFIISSQ